MKLTKPLVILFEKPFAAIFLDRIGPVSVKFCVRNGKLFFFTIMNSHAPIKTKRIRPGKKSTLEYIRSAKGYARSLYC